MINNDESTDSFYRVSDGTLSIDIDKLYKSWKEGHPEFYEVRCRLKDGSKEFTHRFESIETALAITTMMVKTECWVIDSIVSKR